MSRKDLLALCLILLASATLMIGTIVTVVRIIFW